jgi:hypothetical protein
MKAEGRKTKDWRPRLGELHGGTRFRNLYKGIKGKFTIDSIWTGGGGNDLRLQCAAMCQRLLELMRNGDEELLNFSWAKEELRE